jgi:hypothetical protein
VQSISQYLSTQYGNLIAHFSGLGAPFQQALSQSFSGFNNTLNQLGTQLNTGINNLGTTVTNELGPTGSLGSAFASFNPNLSTAQNIANFTTGLTTARTSFLGNGTAGNTGTLGTAVQTNITAPFTTLFTGTNSALNTALAGSRTTLSTALANQFGTSFRNGVPTTTLNFGNNLGVTAPTTIAGVPTTANNGATATTAFRSLVNSLNNLTNLTAAQLNSLNTQNNNFLSNLNGQVANGVQGLSTSFTNQLNANPSVAPDVTAAQLALVNTASNSLGMQANLVNSQLNAINTNVNNQFNTLMNTFGGLGAPFQNAINQSFAAFTNNLGQTQAAINTGLTNVGNFVTSNIGPFTTGVTPTNSISSVLATSFTPGAELATNMNAFNSAFPAAQLSFVGTGQNNNFGTLGTTFQNNVTTPLLATFGTGGTFGTGVTGSVASLSGALANQFGISFTPGATIVSTGAGFLPA